MEKEYKDENITLEKIWNVFKSGEGVFVSFVAIDKIGKVKVDVGKMNSDKSLGGSTEFFIDFFELMSLLDAIIEDTYSRIWPKGFAVFGGHASKKVSHAFRVERENSDSGERWRFACAHFPGTVTSTGAIIREQGSSPLSTNDIKLRLADVAKLRARLRAHITANYSEMLPALSKDS